MRYVDLARPRTLLAPCLDEFAVPGEFHDPRIGVPAMPVGDEDIAARRDQDRRRRVEFVGAVARMAGLAERHQEFAVGTELEDLMAFAGGAEGVGHPHIAIAVDMKAVRKQKQPGPETLHQRAGRVELENGVEIRAVAGERATRLEERRGRERAAALGDPDAGAVRIDVDPAGRAPRPAVGQLSPVLDGAVRIGEPVGRAAGLRARKAAERERGDEPQA